MCRLFFIKFKHSVLSVRFLSLFVLLSIAASLFCINVMLGYAEDLYQSAYDASWFSTICITGMEGECDQITKCISDTYQYEIGSTLSFSEAEDVIVVGWDGNDVPARWFPEMSGDFFSAEQLGDSENIAYLSQDLFEENEQKKYISVKGTEYEVIGYGWIVGYNFNAAIGESSSQTIIDDSDDCNRFMVIPHLTYKKQGYVPQMVLLHIQEISYKQLVALVEDLKEEFPNVEFTQSDNNSDAMRTGEKLKYVPFGIILALIVGISLIQVFAVWFEETGSIARTYIICGMSRKKMMVLMLFEILFFILSGEGVALLIQWSVIPFLSHIGVSCMPGVPDVIVTLTASFLILAVVMLKKIMKNAGIVKGTVL